MKPEDIHRSLSPLAHTEARKQLLIRLYAQVTGCTPREAAEAYETEVDAAFETLLETLYPRPEAEGLERVRASRAQERAYDLMEE